eukprot:TRINITY_DN3916_c0_g1_i3.p1 TRINITY_DN3916_c0_g1~~TRINITY_DN3916_c0_g1_i3.p1  ORF type:complete len:555 (-),score=88.65 TRINITY_DN3916_c0_g1_i3:32-1696(-)
MAVIMYWLHQVIFRSFLASGLCGVSHIVFILTGFLFGAWEDVCFQSKITGPLKMGRAIFWYVATWIVWATLCVGCFHFTDVHYNEILTQWYLGWIQFTIVIQLFAGMWLAADTLNLIPFHWAFKGIFLTGTFVLFGAAISHIIYWWSQVMSKELRPPERWHFVTSMGSYPLIPSVYYGMYADKMCTIKNVWWRLGARCLFVFFFSIFGFFWFHIIFTPLNILGIPDSWYHDKDLIFNFLLALLGLTHSWFCKRWGFVRKVIVIPPMEKVIVTPTVASLPAQEKAAAVGKDEKREAESGSDSEKSSESDTANSRSSGAYTSDWSSDDSNYGHKRGRGHHKRPRSWSRRSGSYTSSSRSRSRSWSSDYSTSRSRSYSSRSRSPDSRSRSNSSSMSSDASSSPRTRRSRRQKKITSDRSSSSSSGSESETESSTSESEKGKSELTATSGSESGSSSGHSTASAASKPPVEIGDIDMEVFVDYNALAEQNPDRASAAALAPQPSRRLEEEGDEGGTEDSTPYASPQKYKVDLLRKQHKAEQRADDEGTPAAVRKKHRL